MTRVADVMTRNVAAVSPEETIRHAARKMDTLDVGALPVCIGPEVIGMITDRDITIRATAAGKAPDTTKVSEAMTGEVQHCAPEDDVADAERKMSQLQVRRLPVLDAGRNLVGVVALGDLAAEGVKGVEATLKEISQPARPDR